MLKEENNCSLFPIKYMKTRWKSWNFHYSTGYKLELHKKPKIYEGTNNVKKVVTRSISYYRGGFACFYQVNIIFFWYHMLGTLIKMDIFESYPVLAFPIAFFLVRHLFYFLSCAMCLAWHWQINSHFLNFDISSCVNLTLQLRRTLALFIFFLFVFHFSLFARF